MSRTRPVVAVDGPAGAGKSTVSRRMAAELGYLLVDTGALYRAVALAAKRRSVDWDDEEAVGVVAKQVADAGDIRLEPSAELGVSVWLGDEDVSKAIRAQEIGRGASKVSAVPEVREALLAMQRNAGREGGVVLEGRDIGTVVFPDAEVKFFLTASVTVRARRRHDELAGRGQPADLPSIEAEVRERDHRDSTRAVAPLKQASDAIVVDSSNVDVETVVDRMVSHVRSVERGVGTPS